ncbi:hypothetical protein K461DRAFT_314356 [Myriangium duriaei CBS 260.36]|uniref:Uncharacterized protein n=1 Tax=Myriangium duriaei CBS 260.36 TaxID=1168546 RepID=A0A9P4J0S7_9PEZI|nr:hypothetical protein K461DRAFT_314356 [Myriangium duriaei CBS 260.36]
MATILPTAVMVPTLVETNTVKADTVKADSVSKPPTVTVVELSQRPKQIPVAPPGFKFVKVKKPDGTIGVVKRPLSAPGAPVTATGAPISSPTKQAEAVSKPAGNIDLKSAQNRVPAALKTDSIPKSDSTTDGADKLVHVKMDVANTAMRESAPPTSTTATILKASDEKRTSSSVTASPADNKVTGEAKPVCKPENTIDTAAGAKPVEGAAKTSVNVPPATLANATTPPAAPTMNGPVSAVAADVVGQSVLTIVKGATAHWFPEALAAGAVAAGAVAIDKKVEAEKKTDEKPAGDAKSDTEKDKKPEADKDKKPNAASTEKACNSNTVPIAQKSVPQATRLQSSPTSTNHLTITQRKPQPPAFEVAQPQTLAQAGSKTGGDIRSVGHIRNEFIATAIRQPPQIESTASRPQAARVQQTHPVPQVQHVQQVVVAAQSNLAVRTQPIQEPGLKLSSTTSRVQSQTTTLPSVQQIQPTVQKIQTVMHSQTIQLPGGRSGPMQSSGLAAAGRRTIPAGSPSNHMMNQKQVQSDPTRTGPNGSPIQSRGPPQGSQVPGNTQQVFQQHLQTLAFNPSTSGLANVGTGLGSHLMQSKSVGAAAAGLALVGGTTLVQTHVLNQAPQGGSRPAAGTSQPTAHRQNTVPHPATGRSQSQISLPPPMTRTAPSDSYNHTDNDGYSGKDHSEHDPDGRVTGDHGDGTHDTSLHQGDDEQLGVWEPGDDEDFNDMADSHDDLTEDLSQQHDGDLDDDNVTPYDPDLDEGVHYDADDQVYDHGDSHTIGDGDQDVPEQTQSYNDEEHLEMDQGGDEPFDEVQDHHDGENMEAYQEGDVSYEPHHEDQVQYEGDEHLDAYQDDDMPYEPEAEDYGDFQNEDEPWNDDEDDQYDVSQPEDDTQVAQNDLRDQNDQHDYTAQDDGDYYQDDADNEQYHDDSGDF